MILIADSGSSKTDWCLADNNKPKVFFSSEGYNPFYTTSASIVESLLQSVPETIDKSRVKTIYFYGSGCVPDKRPIIENALQAIFPAAEIAIESDMYGAARALLGNTSGFAAILGTGTNSCFYNGETITHTVSSLGYILGDEGSGSYLGKKLLADYLRNKLPQELAKSFTETHPFTAAEMMNRVYLQPRPNRFCAAFSKFLSLNITHPYCAALVRSAFSDFFDNLISCYPEYQKYAFNCTGSVAFYFKDLLTEVAAKYGMATGKIIKSPLERLVHYHLPGSDYMH